jgi:hypothetical protein
MSDRQSTVNTAIDALVDEFIEAFSNSVGSADGRAWIVRDSKEKMRLKLKAILALVSEANNG